VADVGPWPFFPERRDGDDWLRPKREVRPKVRPRASRRGISEWLAGFGILVLVGVGAAAAATGGFRSSGARTLATTDAAPRPVGKLAIDGVQVRTHGSSATVRWRTSVSATSYLAFRLGSLGLTASTRSRVGVRHAGVLAGLKRNTIYHLWIVATRKGKTIRRPFVVALPRR
jgi:hypothetical protein